MKLLLDQNLSHKLVAAVADLFPGSAHLRDFAMKRAEDSTIWEFAKGRGFTIVSKDDDFRQLAFLYGPPPKVVWLTVGNCSTSHIEAKLRGHASDLAAFEVDPDAALLVIP